MKVLEVFAEFQKYFERLSAQDQAIHVPEKVAMFLRALDVQDGHDVGMRLEDVTTKSGLTDEWDDARNGVAQFTKRKLWLGDDGKRATEPTPRYIAGPKDRQSRIWDTTTEKSLESTMLDQILKGMEDLKIALVKKPENRPKNSKYADGRCIWCDSAEHGERD